MTQEHAYCLPDTNIFLHYKFFTDIPWRKEIGAARVTVVISDTVLGELAKHKRDATRQRRSERARAAESGLGKMLRGQNKQPTIRSGEELAYKRLDPTLGTLEQHRLAHEEGDDRILALALQLKDADPGARVVIYSGDVPMQVKADELGIEAIGPSADVAELEEPDPQKQEIERLRRELARRQSRSPDLHLQLNRAGPEEQLHFVLPILVSVDEQWLTESIDNTLDELRGHLHRPPPGNFGMVDMFDLVPEEELERYRAELDIYETQYREHLKTSHTYDMMRKWLRDIRPAIVNNGSDVAEDIDLFISVPTRVHMLSSPDGIPTLDPPQRPKLPRKQRELLYGSRGSIFGGGFSPNYAIPPKTFKTRWDEDYSPTIVTDERQHEVRYHVKRLKHGMSIDLDPFYLLFPADTVDEIFRLSCRIVCASQIDLPSWEFGIRVQVET